VNIDVGSMNFINALMLKNNSQIFQSSKSFNTIAVTENFYMASKFSNLVRMFFCHNTKNLNFRRVILSAQSFFG